MNNIRIAAFFFCGLCLLMNPSPATAETGGAVILKGARIHTAAGPAIEKALILIEQGKISAVGRDVSIPGGAEVIDVTGKVITPGYIDIHTHIGVFVADDANEMPQPIGPENRALDALHLNVPEWDEAVKGGVTTVVTGPGSGERMGGQSVTLKTFGRNLDKRILKEAGELKMAVNGVNLSHIPAIRSHFLKAREYMKKWEKYESGDKKGPPPPRDLAMDALAGAVRGEEVVRVHIEWANDIMHFLKLKDEFGFDLQFIHSYEAWKVADELARRNVGAIVMPVIFSTNVTEDMLRGIVTLNRAGVTVAMHSDHPIAPEKWFRLNAALAIRHGLSKEDALKVVTINPAVLAKVDGRVGSLEKGKDADLVVLDGPWYEASSAVEMVFVDGVLAYDRNKDEKMTGEGLS